MSEVTLLITTSPTPAGAAKKDIPEAKLASLATTRQLVGEDAPDSGYFRSLERIGIELNEPQLQAVRHGDGPLLTLAGAGAGKTTMLVCRTGYMLSVRRIPPGRMLLLTFSSKAAAEMRERIAALPGMTGRETAQLYARTFHSFFLQLIRRQGVEQDIFSSTQRQHIVLKQIMRELGIQGPYQPETLLSLLSSYKLNMLTVAAMPGNTAGEKDMKQILLRYEQWKQDNGQMDFDDVLLVAHRMLKDDPGLLRSLQDRFHYVMVDEFQDTNELQYELVRMLAAPRRNLMVVGDDDQTIYSFNGAKSEFLLEFEQLYPDAAVVTLDINYRSTAVIVGLGNEIIRHNVRRRTKTLQATRQGTGQPQYIRPATSDEEAQHIVGYIKREVDDGRRSYGDFAILYRAASNSRAMLEQLMLQDIPHIEYGDGILLYDHGLVKPIVDYLRLSQDRRNFQAMESIMPSLYLNRERAMAHIRAHDQIRPKKGPLIYLRSLPGLRDFQREKIKERLALIRSLKIMKPEQAIAYIRRQFYDAYIEANENHKMTQHKELQKELLDELETSAKRFGTISELLAFIDQVKLKSSTDAAGKSQEQGDRIALMTIHRAKGLEFPVVLLIGACEGSLPHSSALEADRMKDIYTKESGMQKLQIALEEERRLAYVAVTRAREELLISSPSLYRGRKAAVSRFVLAPFESGEVQRGKTMVAVPAWFCTGKPCKAWTRISEVEHALEAKECPLCQAPMAKGSREVPV
ncbi:UvrD-helicase domain-containing protein [Paenibacillus sp. GCM10012307]|uniref:DNA 3'-5' helicase n=1 Tax=Paenibacillus roseus TaxID=2798579 RepID=A0A934JBA9_9BACL|nr:UvrD-helicase domain-containing protein [Paenibacillus roseus]MBJ6364011.1 UvrD-helicase domain-containing protein [Paenibacillus roseus]